MIVTSRLFQKSFDFPPSLFGKSTGRGFFFTTANEKKTCFAGQLSFWELVTQIYADGAIDDSLNGSFRKAQHLCGDFVARVEVHDLTTICQIYHE